jgi:hypothetical protein
MEAASTFVVIKGVGNVVVPVRDHRRAMASWMDCLGFEVTRDRIYGDERWIEVVPPRGGPVPQRRVFFNCVDIQQTYQELRERGIEFPAPPPHPARFRVVT